MTSLINGILERLGQKEGGTSMTLDQITRVLEDLQCSPSTENPEAFTLGNSYFRKFYICLLCISLMHQSYYPFHIIYFVALNRLESGD